MASDARIASQSSSGSRLPSAAWYIPSACLGLKAVVGQIPIAGLPGDAIAIDQDDFHHGHGVERQLQGQSARDRLDAEPDRTRPSCSPAR